MFTSTHGAAALSRAYRRPSQRPYFSVLSLIVSTTSSLFTTSPRSAARALSPASFVVPRSSGVLMPKSLSFWFFSQQLRPRSMSSVIVSPSYASTNLQR